MDQRQDEHSMLGNVNGKMNIWCPAGTEQAITNKKSAAISRVNPRKNTDFFETKSKKN